jgi:hypothetical protein
LAGLEPRGFKWVIAGKLAVSERIGGYGFQHRRVRREEEIAWLADQGIDAVLSLLPGNQNQAAYEGAGFRFYNKAIEEELEPEDAQQFFDVLDEALLTDKTSLLVHRDLIDDQVVGLLGGYLVHAEIVRDPIVATSVIQEIVGRPIGPEGRKLIPSSL